MRGSSKVWPLGKVETPCDGADVLDTCLSRKKQEDELKELEASHKAHLEELNRMVSESKETVRATREEAEVEAKRAVEEHQRKALEAAERQHALERRLRIELAKLKIEGGCAAVHVRVMRAENLPKVDTIGWIDPYLVTS